MGVFAEREERTRVAIDGGDRSNRAEDLRSIAGANRQRSRVVRDVSRPLFEIQLGAVGTKRPATRLEDFRSRDEPQSCITPEGGDGGTNLLTT